MNGAGDDRPPSWLTAALDWTPPPAQSTRGRKPGSRSKLTNTHGDNGGVAVDNDLRDRALDRLVYAVATQNVLTDSDLATLIVELAKKAKVTPRTLKTDIARQMDAETPWHGVKGQKATVASLRALIAARARADVERDWLAELSRLRGK